MRQNFWKKFLKNPGRETSPRPFFWKNQIWAISGSTVWTYMQFVFIVFPSRRLTKYIETKVLTTRFYSIWSFFKNKKRSRSSLLASFSIFLKKILLTLYSINWPNLIIWLPLLFYVSGNMFNLIVCYPVCDVINCEI